LVGADNERADNMGHKTSRRFSGALYDGALGHKVRAAAPVLAPCRELIELGHDPTCQLHAYRNGVLALWVRSIGQGFQSAAMESASEAEQKWLEPRPFAFLTVRPLKALNLDQLALAAAIRKKRVASSLMPCYKTNSTIKRSLRRQYVPH
jgi:hypothetical protein